MLQKSKVHKFIVLLLFFYGCKKQEQFSAIPSLTFVALDQLKDTSGKDSSGVLRLQFTDGDGDMGLSPSDTFPPFNYGSKFYYNFFINYFEKQNGEWVKIVLPPIEPGGDTLTNNSRIPDLTPVGQNKVLQGDLIFELFTNNPFSPYDTIKYDITITDRALNRSNMVTTGEIILVK